MMRFFAAERNVLIVIVLNAIVITMMYFPLFRDNPAINSWLDRADTIITWFFVIELISKMTLYGIRGYFRSGWNRFDFTLIALSLPSLFVGILPIPDTSFWSVLRLLRLLRLLKLFQFVPHIEQLLAGLKRAVRASFMVMAVLALFNFVMALVTCHFFNELVPDLFGDPFVSMYSIFQIFTIEGWNEIPAEIANAVKENNYSSGWLSPYAITVLARIYFATMFLFGGIFGLSLANAIFVDEMTIDNTKDLEKQVDQMQTQLDEITMILKRIENR